MKTSFSWLAAVKALVVKDLTDEFRTRHAFTTMVLFALITLVTVSFTIGFYPLEVQLHAALIWIIIFFSAMSALGRSFVKEEEAGTMLALKMSASAEVIYTGKLLFNLLLLSVLVVVLLPLYFVLMNPPAGANVLLLVLVCLAGLFSLAGATTLLAAVVARAGSKGSLLPILAFPVLLPVLLTAMRGTGLALAGSAAAALKADFIFLLSYMVIVVTVSLLLISFVLED